MQSGTENIFELIPQRPPMVMVDHLISHDTHSTQSGFQLSSENIFCSEGYFTEAGIIENMAQTAALRSGYDASLKGQSPQVGFIGSLKQVQILRLPSDKDVLNTTVTLMNELLQALIIRCETRIEGELIATGEMTIFLKDFSNER